LTALAVIENPSRWPLHIRGVQVVSAKTYLTDPRYAELRGAHVFNLCRTYGYQSIGYYVSLLASARRHRPIPSVETIQDLRISSLLRIASEDFDEVLQGALGKLRSSSFELSIYFGRNLAKRYDRLSRAIFNQFPAPFLRASFVREQDWKLQSLRLIATSDIPDSHRDFVIAQAEQYLDRPWRARSSRQYRYDLAILVNPEADDAPSNPKALRRFVRAAQSLGIDSTFIDRNDYGRVAEFDALFIRENTSVDHYTYRFARRAAAEGLIVIDDPDSIVRCTNKVFQAELFAKHDVACPRTMLVHADNVERVARTIGFPCVLKQPDSSFSRGVIKVESEAELRERLRHLLEDSDLVVVQEFVPSSFDWRVGVLDGRALYVCKYHMVPGHWQIVENGHKARRYGKVETLPVEASPSAAVDLALRATKLIGDGFYGVDVKEVDGRFLVIEVNDNPNVDAGAEDRVLGDELYLSILRCFRERLDARGAEKRP
jgi:glutathione synthase/RimK-type ligase-like ATP-grasp enzyme